MHAHVPLSRGFKNRAVQTSVMLSTRRPSRMSDLFRGLVVGVRSAPMAGTPMPLTSCSRRRLAARAQVRLLVAPQQEIRSFGHGKPAIRRTAP